ncbi:RT0821/Lpp0805 family surface protein [Methylobacterium organophilum]|uniref:RT0821/Lpp0805 family surface protein n=1 Tax=Methylobacterium organophilum TaxID=410 RepID=UPI003B84A913
MRRSDCKALPGNDVRPRRSRTTSASAALFLAMALPASICGCSGPILTFRSEAAATVPEEPTTTGSLTRPELTFGKDLGVEDWRRAHAALSVALDPQGNGRPVKWENPETAMRGSVNPTGLPYVSNDEVCRDFLASVIGESTSRFVRGTGCKPSGSAWELRRLRTAKGEGKQDEKGGARGQARPASKS